LKGFAAQRKGKGDQIMTFVVLLFMLLFIGFCAVILAMGISDVFGKRGGGKSVGVATAQTSNDDRGNRD
jgi:hypothetical protein